jgi:hypothetical protein
MYVSVVDGHEGDSNMKVTARRLISPGYATMLVGAGHTAWGIAAYHEPLGEIVRTGIVGSVGDGVFDTEHDRGARAAGFWFLLAAPLMVLSGYLLEAALRAGDARTVKVGGETVLAIGLVGTTVMPRSGFPAALGVGGWLLHSSRRLRGQASS